MNQPVWNEGQKERERSGNAVFRFFRGLFLFIRNYLIMIGALVTISAIAFGIAFARLQHGLRPEKKEASFSREHQARIDLDLSGPIAEKEPDFTDIIMQLFKTEHELYLPEVRATLKRAAVDPRVARLVVEVGPLSGKPAEFAELRRMLEDFRAKGKPVHAILSEAGDWSYYLASAANTVVLGPTSEVMITGPVFNLVYFGEALKKLGVGIEVLRAGKYKSAFEPFVLDAPSEATIEEYSSMGKSLLGHVVESVAKGRGKPVAEVEGWYKRSVYNADEAVKAGLADKIGYGVEDFLEAREVKDEVQVSLGEYSDAPKEGPEAQQSVDGQGGIGLIEAVGEINMKDSGGPNSDGIAPASLTKRIRWARETSDVKAVVLRVSSPGGSATASDMIWNELQKLAQVKPLVVSMGAYAASGGYYISVPARKIVAEPTTITGSIGVIGMMPNFSQFKDKYGVSFHVVTESDRRAMLNPGEGPTPEDRALMEGTIDHVYQTFLSRVAAGRKMKVEDVAQLAQGRVYTGLEALKLGLVDEIGGMQAAFNAAKEMAGFDVNKLYPVLRYEDERSTWGECLSDPSKLMRCFQQGGTIAPGISSLLTGGQLADAANDGAVAVQRWIEESRREHALALWPAYLGTSLR